MALFWIFLNKLLRNCLKVKQLKLLNFRAIILYLIIIKIIINLSVDLLDYFQKDPFGSYFNYFSIKKYILFLKYSCFYLIPNGKDFHCLFHFILKKTFVD
jgi:hypothetical protein